MKIELTPETLKKIIIEAFNEGDKSIEGESLGPEEYANLIVQSLCKEDPVDAFADTWMTLWPSPAELERHGVGIQKQMSPFVVKRKMKKFFKDFKKLTDLNITCSFSEKCELITIATKSYISRCRERDSWEYIMKPDNFIYHQIKGSLLADLCIQPKSAPAAPSFKHRT